MERGFSSQPLLDGSEDGWYDMNAVSNAVSATIGPTLWTGWFDEILSMPWLVDDSDIGAVAHQGRVHGRSKYVRVNLIALIIFYVILVRPRVDYVS